MEDLAALIAGTVKGVRPARARLRLVATPPPSLYDNITRTSVLTRIRRLRTMYDLAWLVEQACFDQPGLECLADEALSALLQDMERARECIADGTSFEDAGLVRDTFPLLPENRP